MGKSQDNTAAVPTHRDAPVSKTVGGFPAVPTTKVLALARLSVPLTPEQRRSIMPREVPDTVRLFLAGRIDQWWSRQDGKGPVFLMNVASVEEAHALLEQLPLAQAKLIEFDRSTSSSARAGRKLANSLGVSNEVRELRQIQS